MPTTFTALYDRREDAERVQAELERLGIIDVDGMNVHDRDNSKLDDDRGYGSSSGSSSTLGSASTSGSGSSSGSTTGRTGRGFFDQMRDLFVSEEDSHHYAEGVRRGHYLLTVRTDEQNADRVHDILDKSGAVDVDEKAASWKKEGWTAPVAAAGALGATAGTQRNADRDMSRGSDVSEERIPIAEEQLVVGKRNVSRGSTRIRSYVEETPVNEQISLREEHVDIERRPVDQPLRAGDLGGDPFQERSIEVTETAEEAVVAKEARVVEEVVVHKDVGERVETVHDTVRRTNVEIDKDGDDRLRGSDRLRGDDDRLTDSDRLRGRDPLRDDDRSR